MHAWTAGIRRSSKKVTPLLLGVWEGRRLQNSSTPLELLSQLQSAVASGKLDDSVLSAALKRCEQGKWWDALLKVKDVQEQHKLPMTSILLSSYLTALARCANAENGVRNAKARRREALQRAKETWRDLGDDSHLHDQVLVNGVLHVCLSSRQVEGLAWAEKLWHLGKKVGICFNVVNCSTYATVLEMHDKHDQVDTLLNEAADGAWRPNQVTLGSLLNAAAEGRHWQRAEWLWERLTGDFHVPPSKIAWAARVKAHILCGRPRHSAKLGRQCVASGIQPHYKLAEDLVQASMVVYHSSIEAEDRSQLQEAIQLCSATFEAEETSKRQQRDWDALQDVARGLLKAPDAFRLRSLLLEQKARQGAMATWPNYAAGTNYLEGEES